MTCCQRIHNFGYMNFKEKIKDPAFIASFAGYAIPGVFLLYVLYINFLPFGYRESFVINVGAVDDTKVDEWYLEPSVALGERKTSPDGTPYRELNGMATAVFKPKVVLDDAEVTVEVTGEGTTLIPPVISLDPTKHQWDYSWDFTQGIPAGFTNSKAFVFDGATYFDGTARVEMPGSADLFENGAFSLYAEWFPMSAEGDGQQIVGHYNWELWQNKNSVSFRIGRVNDNKGETYTIKYPADSDFFNKKHSALAIYSPGESGFIELFVDNTFADRFDIGTSTIWKDYGKNNLMFGMTKHNSGKNPGYKGGLDQVKIVNKNILNDQHKVRLIVSKIEELKIPIISSVTTTLKEINLHVVQK